MPAKEKHFAINALINKNRKNFDKETLKKEELHPDPFQQFGYWLSSAIEKDMDFANAMTLSTLGENSQPDSRVVFLRNISYGGFTFYTNYRSKKAMDIALHSKACLNFFWKEQMRQVKIQGEIKFLPPKESDDYFESRPFRSQVGAWASQQSQVIKDRQSLDEAYDQQLKKYENKKVPRPEHWGGYVLIPYSFEFWQGRPERLHDRIVYEKTQSGGEWFTKRLMP